MGEAKRRKKLDSTWGKPNFKPYMKVEDYRDWALHELGRDTVICFCYFNDTFVGDLPSEFRANAPQWLEMQERQVQLDFLKAITFDNLNGDFLSEKSEELAVKYKKLGEQMYFEVLKGLIVASTYFELYIDDDDDGNDAQKSPFSISYEELDQAQIRFKKRTNPVYQKCADIGIDLAECEQIIKNSLIAEELEQAVLELTFKLRFHPEIISEIIDSVPTLWILSETRKLKENGEQPD